NSRRGDLFLFHRNEHLNARDYFERFDVFGTEIDRPKAPYRQYQWGGTMGGPLQTDRTFYFVSLERLDVEANSFINIDANAAALLNARGFPVVLGHVPYDLDATQLNGKLSHQWAAARSITLSGHLSAVTNGNFRAYGGLTAASHGVSQDRNDWALSATESDVWGRGWVNEARGQIAQQDQQTVALDPRCGGACTSESGGGPEITIPGVAVLGRNIYEPTERNNWRLQFSDVVSRASGTHLMKAGTSFTYLSQQARTPLEFGGSFTFAALPAIPGLFPVPISAFEAFALELPALYVRGFGNSAGPFTYQEFGAFAQDDWRVTPRLTLKAGVRYQLQAWPALETNVSSVGGTTLSYSFPQDHNNLAPRLAASFDLTGDGRTSIDAAYGVFYGSQLASILGSQIVFDGSPDGVRLLVLPFPGSVAAWQAPDHRPEEPAVPFPSSVITVAPDLKTPYAHQTSIGLTHAIGDRLQVAASFIRVNAFHQIGSLNYNPLLPSLGPGRRPNDIAGIPGTSAEVFQFTDFGRSWYRGLLLSLRRRLADGFDVMASYTLSKAEDDSSTYIGYVEDNGAGRNPADPEGLPIGFNPDLEKGPSDTDQRHRLVLSGSYLAPAGFQLSAIIAAASARPFTPLAGADMNGDGLLFADRARTTVTDPTTSVGRNSERMDHEFRVDLRVSRRFALSGATSVDVMVDMFNLFNQTNFTEVNNTFGPGAFPQAPVQDAAGRVTYGLFQKAAPPRQFQLGARLNF
ncbi:MAG TPA: TonB-dependent receptor, partial [Vicinamibacterales bacterium]|nr:TonB-dependent receptor [Vicinamibacterales bacterium]